MKAGHNKKSVRVEFVMSEQEAELVKGRMAELGITNLSAYFGRNTGNGFLPKYAILRKIALLANLLSSEKRSIIYGGGVTMDYITTKDAAAKWGISDRRVLQYCTANRIDGAIKMGNMWLIPKSVEKPVDGRTKQGKEQKHE